MRGWSARVDGRPAPIHATDGLMLGLALPAGSHRVSLAYATPYGRTGGLLSLAGVLACAALAFTRRKVSPAGTAPAPP